MVFAEAVIERAAAEWRGGIFVKQYAQNGGGANRYPAIGHFDVGYPSRGLMDAVERQKQGSALPFIQWPLLQRDVPALQQPRLICCRQRVGTMRGAVLGLLA
jgi:hypothetical protein